MKKTAKCSPVSQKAQHHNWVFFLLVFIFVSCVPQPQAVNPEVQNAERQVTNPVEVPTLISSPTPTGDLVQPTETPPIPTANEDKSGFPAKGIQFEPYSIMQVIQYTVRNSDKTTPEDILKEVSYSGGAGGGRGGCGDIAPGITEPEFFSEPRPITLEWKERSYADMCGWTPDEPLLHQIISPQGNVIFEETWNAGSDGGLYYISLTPFVNLPPGIYIHRITGRDSIRELPVTVEVPTEPRLYIIQTQLEPDNSTGINFFEEPNFYLNKTKNNVILYNFKPQEKVRLFIYASQPDIINQVADLVDWVEVQVDAGGQLNINLTMELSQELLKQQVWLIAVGEVTGEVREYPHRISHPDRPIISPFKFTISIPTDDEIRQSKKMWSLLEYREMYSPGVEKYTLELNSSDSLTWRFAWCAVDKNTLSNTLRQLTVNFIADNVKLDSSQVGRSTLTPTNGWACERWTALLSDMKPGSKHTLEMQYELKADVSDGTSTYKAGSYQQVVELIVE